MSASQSGQSGPIGLRDLGVAAVLYAVLACVATWPLALHFNDHVPGADVWRSQTIHSESLLNLWNLWWFRHALVDLGQDPFACQHVLYPIGVNLWFHTLAPLHGLVGSLLQSFFSLAAAQNLLLWLELVAAGVCSYALARQLGIARGGARVAGALFAFSPAVFGHLYAGHYELIATFWLPALLGVFLRLLAAPEPRLRDACALGLLWVGAAYSSQYYFVYGVELLALTALLRFRRVWRKPMLAPLAVALSIAAIGLTPLVWQFAGGSGPQPNEGAVLATDFARFSGDAIGFAVPSFTHPILSQPLAAVYDQLGVARSLPQETTGYLGFGVLALAVFALRERRNLSAPVGLLLAIGVVFWLLSLGSQLRLAGFDTGFPLPGRLLQELPVVRLARAPGRHIVVAMLGFALLAGAGWERLARHWLRGCALALLAFEYLALPLPLQSTQVSPVALRLAELPGDFAVLEIPLGVRDGQAALGWPDNRQIHAQTVHQHPIVAAAVSRLPAETWRQIAQTPVIGTLLDPQSATPETQHRDRAEGPAFFARWRIDAVVVHPEASGTVLERYVEAVLPIGRRERFADGSQLWWLREREPK